nr:hypothetical protein [Acidobacteriota bacterium]
MNESKTDLAAPPLHGLREALEPGVMLLRRGGAIGFADERAMRLLGCSDRGALERFWGELQPRLEGQGLRWPEQEPASRPVHATATIALGATGRSARFDLSSNGRGDGVL